MAWEPVVPSPSSPLPTPRYFHSSVVFNDYMIIIGGQGDSPKDGPSNLFNDICFFNMQTKEWEILQFDPLEFPPRYAHLCCITGHTCVIVGGQDGLNQYLHDMYFFDLDTRTLRKGSIDCGLGCYRSTLSCQSGPNGPVTIFSNTRFSNPIRELITVEEGKETSLHLFPSSGQTLPPALRFPEGFIIGKHMVISGVYISNNVQSYCLWSLNLDNNTWSRIDTGSSFARGSWNRGMIHPTSNQFLVFGHREREIISDYGARRINFNHVSFVNLEAFNVYRLPSTCKKDSSIQIGLQVMYGPRFSNFSFLTKDDYRIHINSGFLRARWPNFDAFLYGGQDILQAPHLKANTLVLQESYPVVQAFVKYLYTNSVEFITDLDLLGKLLLFSRNYAIQNLSDLVAAEMHRMLDINVAPQIYQAAAQAQRDGLKLRSLSVMIQERQALLKNNLFWKSYPAALRNEILTFMPPNFQPPVEEPIRPVPPPSRKLNADKPSDTLPSPSNSQAEEHESSKDTLIPLPNIFPKKKTSGTSFLKFGGRRPSLANLFSFSSSSNSLAPPAPADAPSSSSSSSSFVSTTTDKSPKNEPDYHLVRSLYDVGLS